MLARHGEVAHRPRAGGIAEGVKQAGGLTDDRMNCNELDSVLHEFLDNELAADMRTEVANHLASCRRCAVKVAAFEHGDRQLRAAQTVEPPADFLQQVRGKIRSQQEVTAKEVVPAKPKETESVW